MPYHIWLITQSTNLGAWPNRSTVLLSHITVLCPKFALSQSDAVSAMLIYILRYQVTDEAPTRYDYDIMDT